MGAENASREVCVVGGVFYRERSGSSARTREAASAGAGGEERRVFDVFESGAERRRDESEIRRRDDEVTLRREGIVVVGRVESDDESGRRGLGDDFEKATSSATEIHETKVPNETIAKRRAVDSKARKSKRGILGGVSCHLDVRVERRVSYRVRVASDYPFNVLVVRHRPKQSGLQNGKKKKNAQDDSKGPKTTFKDVAGVDEAKQELYELVQMLRNEERYKEVRHRLPAGCLLVGPPGTGKTLLARAVAGEAGVAFFPVAASEFVELFVGRGAARVRELFAEARKKSPCVVFIDELDAIGARRGAGLNEERDQTLNQMLVEMDGFNKAAGVLVLAATNRPDALDPALTRPGRLTRRVFVGPPTTSGRAQILAVHLRGMRLKEPLGQICEAVARQTPGFTGAELANACNEAALLAARNGKDACGYEELMEGVERTRNGVGAGVWGGSKVDPSKVLSDLRARFLGDFDVDGGTNILDANGSANTGGGESGSSPFAGVGGGGAPRKLKDEYLGQGVSISQGPS